MTGDLVPEPDIKHSTRANQAYREAFLDQLTLAYAENVISSSERDARAVAAQREGVTTDDLRRLTMDLPEPADPEPHPSAQTRVLLYIAAGAASLMLAIGGPTIAASVHSKAPGVGIAMTILAVITCVAGIAALICTIFAACNDKAVLKEYG